MVGAGGTARREGAALESAKVLGAHGSNPAVEEAEQNHSS
jgi:hypothetical protein